MPHRLGFSKRCFQFSLHALLYLMTFACCAFGWRHERSRREKEVATLAKEYEEQSARSEKKLRAEADHWRASFRKHLGDRGWELTGVGSGRRRDVPFTFVASVDEAERYGAEQIDDAVVVSQNWSGGDLGLWHLCAFERLARLHLTTPKVTNDGLYCLRHLKELRDLQLNLPAVDDRGLEHVRSRSMAIAYRGSAGITPPPFNK